MRVNAAAACAVQDQLCASWPIGDSQIRRFPDVGEVQYDKARHGSQPLFARSLGDEMLAFERKEFDPERGGDGASFSLVIQAGRTADRCRQATREARRADSGISPR